MIASPQEITEDLKTKLGNEVDFFHAADSSFNDNSKLIFDRVAAADKTFLEEDYKRLISALAFLSNVYVLEKKHFIEDAKMEFATQEGAAGREVRKTLETQSPLKEVLPNSKTELGTVVVWHDPIQLEIMRDKTTKRQVMVGLASTGKTILIQLKVLEIIEQTEENVFIILPYKNLEEQYKHFFENSGVDTNGRIVYVTPEMSKWKNILEESMTSHWFIDEFASIHAGYKELSNLIQTLQEDFREDQFLWVTVDLQQKFEYFSVGFDPSPIPEIENSTKRHLMFIHRCTGNVFNQYRENTSKLIEMGHQYEVNLDLFST